MVLSAASITNLSRRAWDHHKDWSSYLVGAGLAALVPVAVFVAIKINGWQYKTIVWAIAIVFACISATIQYQVYLPTDASTEINLEALSFGAGVPVAECLLAAMEAFLLVQIAKQSKDEAKAAIEDESKKQQAEQQAELERRKQEIDLEMYKRQKEAELEEKRLKLEAKLSKSTSKNVSNQVSKNVSTDEANTPIEQANRQSELDKVLDIYRQNPKASLRSVGKQLDRSPQTISNWLDELEGKGIIHRNGQVEVL